MGLEAEVKRLQAEVASLRLTLGGKTFSADVPEPIGCPMPGACVQVAELKRLHTAAALCAVNGEMLAALRGLQMFSAPEYHGTLALAVARDAARAAIARACGADVTKGGK